MFLYDEVARLHWFRASGMDLEMEYELIGVLIGGVGGWGGRARVLGLTSPFWTV
jgi:hypothetical protein